MASPLVCVAKKQGGVRLACDYRYVNSFTVADVFPLCTIDVIRKVGQGNLISTFDTKSELTVCVYLCSLSELCVFVHCVDYVDIDRHLHLGYVTLQEVVYVSRVLYTT